MKLPSGLNFLLVEDLISDTFLLQRQLKKISENPEIRFVDSELSLINALKTYIPDIIITDFNLVGMDAFDVIRVVKEYNDNTPVIVITAHLKNEADRELLLEKGASGFFLKEPVNTLNERLLPLFQTILETKQEDLDHLGRQRRKYQDSKSHSDFLRAHDYDADEIGKEITPPVSLWQAFLNLFKPKQQRV